MKNIFKCLTFSAVHSHSFSLGILNSTLNSESSESQIESLMNTDSILKNFNFMDILSAFLDPMIIIHCMFLMIFFDQSCISYSESEGAVINGLLDDNNYRVRKERAILFSTIITYKIKSRHSYLIRYVSREFLSEKRKENKKDVFYEIFIDISKAYDFIILIFGEYPESLLRNVHKFFQQGYVVSLVNQVTKDENGFGQPNNDDIFDFKERLVSSIRNSKRI